MNPNQLWIAAVVIVVTIVASLVGVMTYLISRFRTELYRRYLDVRFKMVEDRLERLEQGAPFIGQKG